MTLLQKIRTLAAQDATIQEYCLGSNGTLRWFDTQIPKGYIYQGTCVTVQQINDVLTYVQPGPLAMDQVRVQVNIWDLNSASAKTLANYLVMAWFPSVSFMSDAQFQSPPTTPPYCANFKLSQRGVIDYSVQPQPAWVETLDFRLFNNPNI
jgi:hypothetical protein